MKINNKTHITLSSDDIKDMIIKQLYHSQGISGIFNVKFKIVKQAIPSQYPQDSTYKIFVTYINGILGILYYINIFDGAEVTVNLNEK